MRLGIEAGSETLSIAVQENISGVPIFLDQLLQDGVDKTLAPIQENGLEVCQIGAFGFNPLAPDAQMQEATRQLEQGISIAAQVKCPYITITGGNYHPSGFLAGDPRNHDEATLGIIATRLKPVLAIAEAHEVKLTIEPYLKAAINSPEQFLKLKGLLGSDALRINIDVTSLYDYQDMLNPSPKVTHICQQLAGHYGLVHIKDVVLKEGFHIHIDLAPLGSSPTDWSHFLSLVAPHIPKDSWLILEHVANAEEARQSLLILKNAADKAKLRFSR